jgi:hypothetical protein
MPGSGIPDEMIFTNIAEFCNQNTKIYYIDHQQFVQSYWTDNFTTVNPGFLKLLQKNLLSVIDLSTEHWGPSKHRLIDCVYDQLESSGYNFLILSHRPEDHQRRPNLFFYPSEYHNSKSKFIYPSQQDLILPRRYKISCLNHFARPHRIYNWYKAKDKKYFSECLWSMHNQLHPRPDDPQLSEEIWESWNKCKDQFFESPQFKDSNYFVKTYVWNLDHPAYTDAYINIIAEHSVIEGIYMSEKTWKPVASGQLFLSVGNPGSIDYLRSVGVQVFDDVIDHSYYDNEMDWQSRIDRMHEILDDLVSQDLDAVYWATYQQRKMNQENFQSGMFDSIYSSCIKHKIFSLLGENG